MLDLLRGAVGGWKELEAELGSVEVQLYFDRLLSLGYFWLGSLLNLLSVVEAGS